uniref:Minor capsid protein P9 transmembrane helices domain-containing protein n=1 Tax=Nucleocytoviricota sp. TaxID=2809609 RepID=A0A9E8G8K5_9VIRU|nr:hypothetical protein [Nucleocytoviricota sp.]UZT29125.1 hypothetical protein [Nucleocytoviricota sp.]
MDTNFNKNSNKEIINKNYVDFWTKNPAILLDSDYISQIWISKNMTKNEKLNAITRLVIILTLFSYIIIKNIKILIAGIVTIIVIVFLYYSQDKLINKSENFANINNKKNEKLDKLYSDPKYFTQSTIKNPLSNVQPQEIIDNPKRKEAPPSYNKKVEQQINNNTKEFIAKNFDDETIGKKLFNDLGDNLQFENSMRQFYSTSSTTVPNDQEAFLKFCYSEMKSCRGGDEIACSNNNFRHVRHN